MRESERLHHRLDARAVVLHEELDRAHSQHRPTVLGVEEVGYVLSDRDHAQIALAGPPCQPRHEAASSLVLHEVPCLIND